MNCVKCGESANVVDSRPAFGGKSIRRRLWCLNKNCEERFTTYEFHSETLRNFQEVLEKLKIDTQTCINELLISPLLPNSSQAHLGNSGPKRKKEKNEAKRPI